MTVVNGLAGLTLVRVILRPRRQLSGGSVDGIKAHLRTAGHDGALRRVIYIPLAPMKRFCRAGVHPRRAPLRRWHSGTLDLSESPFRPLVCSVYIAACASARS